MRWKAKGEQVMLGQTGMREKQGGTVYQKIQKKNEFDSKKKKQSFKRKRGENGLRKMLKRAATTKPQQYHRLEKKENPQKKCEKQAQTTDESEGNRR